jgi:ornithine cyclodeaminase/alanine dehydrogenase-like protein (mu-crystallin family)
MHTLDAQETKAALPFERLVPALREAFAKGAMVPTRHHHAVEQPDGPAATLLLMPAWQDRYLGIKLVTVHPANPGRGLPAVHALYLLSDSGTGQPVALLDGGVLTARRTAAASALAAGYLARRDAASLLLVGAGRVASLIPAAMRTVRPIRRVRVWNRSRGRAKDLVQTLQAQGFDAALADALDAEVRQADVVSCATVSSEPLVRGAWLWPGTHLDLVGAFTPSMREADEDAVSRAAVYADTEAALHECGELAGLEPAGLRGTLETLSRGTAPGRLDAAEVTLFKSVGTALEDLAGAALAVG